MSDYAAAAQIIATLASTGTQAYTTYNAATAPNPAKLPIPQMQDNTQFARGLLPTQKANAAAGVGGGISPEFLAGLVEQGAGPEGALGILGDIRRSLGPGQAPQSP